MVGEGQSFPQSRMKLRFSKNEIPSFMIEDQTSTNTKDLSTGARLPTGAMGAHAEGSAAPPRAWIGRSVVFSHMQVPGLSGFLITQT